MSTTTLGVHNGRETPVLKTSSRRKNRVGSRPLGTEASPPESLGQRIATRRIELHLTQAQVAGRVTYQPKSGRRKGAERRLSRATLAMYELNASEPSLKTVQEIAAALKVSAGWLAFGETPTNMAPDAANASEKQKIETVWVAPQLVSSGGSLLSSGMTPALVINIHG